MSLRDQIIQAPDIKIEPVKAWGLDFYVKGMNGLEHDAYQKALLAFQKDGAAIETSLTALMVAICACDEAGKRIFTDADTETLARKSAAELDTVADVARKLSGFGAARPKSQPSDGSITA